MPFQVHFSVLPGAPEVESNGRHWAPCFWLLGRFTHPIGSPKGRLEGGRELVEVLLPPRSPGWTGSFYYRPQPLCRELTTHFLSVQLPLGPELLPGAARPGAVLAFVSLLYLYRLSSPPRAGMCSLAGPEQTKLCINSPQSLLSIHRKQTITEEWSAGCPGLHALSLGLAHREQVGRREQNPASQGRGRAEFSS